MTNDVIDKNITELKKVSLLKDFVTKQGLLVALILMIVVFSLLSPYFLSIKNFLNIALALAITLMLSTGETVAIICGLTDLSIASTLAFSSVIMAILLAFKLHFVIAILIALLLGAIIG